MSTRLQKRTVKPIAPERKEQEIVEQEVTIKINDIQEKPSLRLRAI